MSPKSGPGGEKGPVDADKEQERSALALQKLVNAKMKRDAKKRIQELKAGGRK